MRTLAGAGWQVRALVRREARDLPAELVLGNLADPDALGSLCYGVDVVIHSAGLVKARNRQEFFDVNATGAKRVAEAAARAPHVIHVSSLVAREPALSHYAASKKAGEVVMEQVLGARLSIVRPPAIYGPADRELLPVFQAADSLPALPVFASRARIAMIHVADAARQIAALADRPPGRVTALSDHRPEGYGWRDLMAAAAHACGRSPRLVRAPEMAIRILGLYNDLMGLSGQVPMLNSGKARELLHPDWALAPEERSVDLPTAQYGLEEGFAETVAWYRTAAWMKQ